MAYLLDTHTFLWFVDDKAALSTGAKSVIEMASGQVYLSIASIWEMAVKVSLGKLSVPQPFKGFINKQVTIKQVHHFRD